MSPHVRYQNQQQKDNLYNLNFNNDPCGHPYVALYITPVCGLK